MSVTAKFKVARVTPMQWGDPDTAEVELTPDYAQGRNADWAKYTPAGVFRMTVNNPNALTEFKEGRAFTVTFEADDE